MYTSNGYKCLFLFIFLIISIKPSFSQDTLWTQVFNFQSTTRDTMVNFPEGDHTQYEKILMYYTMRCKKGLVSTGTNRNLGCGEWDYSCNTNVIDSSMVDSLQATHPNYIISGFNETFFPYTTLPTHTIHTFPVKNINVSNQGMLTSFSTVPVLPKTDVAVSYMRPVKAYFVFHKNELSSLTSGNLNGLKLFTKGNGKIDYFVCNLAQTNTNDLSYETVSALPFTSVVQRGLNFSGTNQNILFDKPFSYTAGNHIVLELTLFGRTAELQDLSFSFDNTPDVLAYSNTGDQYIQMGSQGIASLPVNAFSTIKKEITVGFWSRGNSLVLPNNNSIFEATDGTGNRQLNVHLPWSNGRIYWDAGFSNGSYDRIDKAAVAAEYTENWNHWVFTKNTTTGSMKIYLNGSLWHTGTAKSKEMNIQNFVIGGATNGTLLYHGDVDDFGVWNKELTASEIQKLLTFDPTGDPDLSENLVAYYDFNKEDNQTIYDQSSFQLSAGFSNVMAQKRFAVSELFKAVKPNKNRLSVEFLRGQVTLTTNNSFVSDSILNPPFQVTEYTVENSNLVKGQTRYLWMAGFYPVYNESGDVIDETEYPEEDVIIIEDLIYFRKFPSKFELLSFVTPYGIGLDFGMSGKTWVFDVTDFGPVLKNRKRFLMDRGGEWQEEMDIRFAFIKGIPARPVLSIRPIWPVEAYGYTSILSNDQLEPRRIQVEPDVHSMKIRSVATGHGQEGEFIPRTHSILVNNTNFSWQLWTECADNPVYPQGGTWVYDRAGWCPGAPSDLREFEIMSLIGSGSNFMVDYGLNTAAGDSRYIINNQLVKYGPPNHQLDISLEDIISPSTSILQFRKNPVCANPEVLVRNNGTTAITSVEFKYGVEGQSTHTFTWTGNIPFLKNQSVSLPNLPGQELWNGGNFVVWVEKINGVEDVYKKNNQLRSTIEKTPYLQDGIIISMRPNNAPHETSWTLRDEAGNLIKQSRSGMAANIMYNDTISNLNGCYTLQFRDSDDDGIAWWANGDGNGFIRAKGLKETGFRVFQPDFGREYSFRFAAGMTNSTEATEITAGIQLKPNPVYDRLVVGITGQTQSGNLQIFNISGEKVWEEFLPVNQSFASEVNVDVVRLPAGMYTIKWVDGQKSYVKKFVKL